MDIEQDPDLEQESATATDPQVEEEAAEVPEEESDEALDVGAEDDSEAGTDDSEDGSQQEDQDGEDSEEEADEAEVIVEGQEAPPKEASSNKIKDLRKGYRDLKSENADLKRALAERGQREAPPAQAPDPGPKPTMETCGYDEQELDKQLDGWHTANQRHQVAQTQAKQEAQVAQQAWEGRKENYRKNRAEIMEQLPNYEEAETVVQGMFSDVQQGIILQAARNPALVIAALGRYPNLAKDLAAKKDFVTFAAEVGRLETLVKKPVKKTSAPPPEKPVRGSGAISGKGDAHLDKLRAQAEKTGDYTAVVAHKKKHQK